jgi:GTP-binding protein LepA
VADTKDLTLDNIRNFCIIAHIDHGKSTLADRFLQKTLGIPDRDFRNQMLDTMDLERERGITIKSQAVTLPFTTKSGEEVILNLIDTPGHVDFTYEVSRSLASCEGALLLIDASQGVEAQTVANLYLAVEHDLEIIPVINKIDLPSADIERVKEQIENELGLFAEDALLCSAKTGEGVEEILEAIVERIPAPEKLKDDDDDDTLKALIFDSVYDSYRGVLIYVRVFSGSVKAGDRIRFHSTGAVRRVEEVGVLQLKLSKRKELGNGQVGYIIAGVKTVNEARTGDTVTMDETPCKEALPGFTEIKPVVFSSIYPISADDYGELVDAMERLKLNDASLVYQKDSSAVLGQGFRCGFLGLLHLEIVQERLQREHDMNILLTAPSVQYNLTLIKDEKVTIDNPIHYPDPVKIVSAEEPYIKASIFTPGEYLGNIISLCINRRGAQKSLNYLDAKRVEVVFEIPLAEVIFDFYDRLKSVSRGYASFDYEFLEYRPTKLVKVDVLVNHEPVDALAVLVHESNSVERARHICKRLSDSIPRHQFKIPIQGAIGGKVISRETVQAFRKDVTAKCYGGDISRKRKLLEKQKKGKRKMMEVASVTIPQDAFLNVLKHTDD